MDVKKLTLKSNTIPEILTTIPQPPKQLFVIGNLQAALDMPRVAIVGSRKVSSYGRNVTESLARDLTLNGIAIISGLALGVDAIAHTACLDAGGITIAVLPTSLEDIYPASHRALARRILENGGALISEYEPGSTTYKQNFIERNRLVSGIADAILIPEAAHKSGTLHTANFALDQGKTVMAVPGNITSESSGGTNNLLKTGALLVTEVNDVLSALHIEARGSQKKLPFASNQNEHILLHLLSEGTNDTSELQLSSGLSPSEFNQTLTMLEITGKITALGSGRWGIR